jgi:hypothetical protein
MKSILLLFVSFILIQSTFAQYPANSPVALNGALHMNGLQLVNAAGVPYQLKGFATAGLQYYPTCYTQGSFDAMHTTWGANVIRLSMYVAEGGYNNDPAGWKVKVDQMVDWCAIIGVYCIIDWHVLTPGNPLDPAYGGADDFWVYMATKHKGKAHVLYEICNEPNGVDWPTIKQYADRVIPKIRAIDPNTIIICGTPIWSSQPQDAINNKLLYSNIMYTLHIYAGSSRDYDFKKQSIIPFIPLFVTEFGTCDGSGNGGYDAVSSNTWLDIFEGQNPSGVKISWCNWSFSDKAETASALVPGSCASSSWGNATTPGILVRSRMLNPIVCNTVNLPGTVKAENYCDMFGVLLEACTDVGGGKNLSYIDPGDWVSYSVSVATAADYKISFRTASLTTAGQLQLLLNGVVKLTQNFTVTGGWQTWSTVSTVVHLDAGIQTLRLNFTIGNFNLNTIDFAYNGVVTGIEAIGKAPEITLYPNPNHHKYLILNQLENMPETNNIQVYDMQGRIVLSEVQPRNTTSMQLNIETLHKGLYFLGTGVGRTQKFVVE